MASLQLVSESKIYGTALKKIVGVEPDYNIQSDFIELYYPPDKLKKAQQNFKTLIESKPGKIRYNIAPVVLPYYLKKAAPFAAGLLIAGYIAGKVF